MTMGFVDAIHRLVATLSAALILSESLDQRKGHGLVSVPAKRPLTAALLAMPSGYE